MRNAWAICVTLFVASGAWAQTAAEQSALDQCLAKTPGDQGVARVFYVPEAATDVSVRELFYAIQTTTEVRWALRCTGVRAISVRGTDDQLAATDWLIREVYSSGAGPQTPAGPYNLSNTSTPVVRLFRLQRLESQQQLVDMVNLLRTVTELQRIVQVNTEKIIIVRGDADRVAMAEWLVDELDQSPQNFPRQYEIEDQWAPVARILPLPQVQDTMAAFEVVNLIRTISELQRVALLSAGTKTVAVRGTAERVALADWLVKQLDNPNGAVGKGAEHTADQSQSVRVFYMAASSDAQDLANRVKSVRDAAKVQRVAFYSPNRVLMVRGTPDQLAAAERVISAPN